MKIGLKTSIINGGENYPPPPHTHKGGVFFKGRFDPTKRGGGIIWVDCTGSAKYGPVTESSALVSILASAGGHVITHLPAVITTTGK